MKKNGFTLIELLICLAMLGFVLVIGILVTRDTLATSLTQLRDVSDNEVFSAARSYVLSENIAYNSDNYVCVSVTELIQYGYLQDTFDEQLKSKNVMVTRDSITKVIRRINYSDSC